MPALGLKVNSYTVQLGQKFGFGSQTAYWTVHAVIKCACDNNYSLVIYFLTPDSAVPAAYYKAGSTSGGAASIFLPFNHFPSYMDLLRNEGPVSAYIWTDKPETCHLYTGNEIPGEGE